METVIKKTFQAFQYSSPAEFHHDYYDFFRSYDKEFSYRQISKECNLRSRTEARNLIKGLKEYTPSIIMCLKKIFPINDKEAEYLCLLSQLNQVGINVEMTSLFKNIFKIQDEKSFKGAFLDI